MKNRKWTQLIAFILVLVIIGIFLVPAITSTIYVLSRGQRVYVPVYSHIYHGDKEKQFDLTATLSIRNTNLKKDIILQSIDYFDSNGNLLKRYLKTPMLLKKFSSIRYVIKSTDSNGGSGAKFIVKWKSRELVNSPLIEAIMISTDNQQGISFVSRGQAIQELKR